MISIIQNGKDGFGHQLHGLFSCLLLHGIKDFVFASDVFPTKMFIFDHLKPDQYEAPKNYMKEVVSLFASLKPSPKIEYREYVHAHETKNIPSYHRHVVYGLDNAYYFDRIGMNEAEAAIHKANIDVVKQCFINKCLPPNRLKPKTIMIHIRLGDAITTGRGESIAAYNQKILKLIDILKAQYPDHEYCIHTDGNVDFLTEKLKLNNLSHSISEKSTTIMQVVSDFIYSDILICGYSSLSQVCSFLGNKTFVIHNDDNPLSMPENISWKITDYIIEQQKEQK